MICAYRLIVELREHQKLQNNDHIYVFHLLVECQV